MARRWLANLFCLGAVSLIAVTFFHPMWVLTAKAATYQQDFPEGLKVYVYLTEVRGDLYEFEIMNKWIGAHFPAQVPEHVVFPVFFGGLALLCFAAMFLNPRKQRALGLALILFLVLGIAGPASLQWRLYAFGHDRNPNAPVTVPDFTVPIVGSARLYNWSISTDFSIGAYSTALAALLVALAYVLVLLESRRRSARGVTPA